MTFLLFLLKVLCSHSSYIVYASYLFFQLYSHATLYTDEGIQPSTRYPKKNGKGDADVEQNIPEPTEKEEEEMPQMSLISTIVLLVAVTVVCPLPMIFPDS